MKARLKLKPGQKGTKKLVEIYGDALVCIRYRYDEVSQSRIKTVELIVEKKKWTPPKALFTDLEQVPVKIAYAETELKNLAKKAGGRWDPEKKVWIIQYGRIKGNRLAKHIVIDALQTTEKTAGDQ